jgi:hypothetical protein
LDSCFEVMESNCLSIKNRIINVVSNKRDPPRCFLRCEYADTEAIESSGNPNSTGMSEEYWEKPKSNDYLVDGNYGFLVTVYAFIGCDNCPVRCCRTWTMERQKEFANGDRARRCREGKAFD